MRGDRRSLSAVKLLAAVFLLLLVACSSTVRGPGEDGEGDASMAQDPDLVARYCGEVGAGACCQCRLESCASELGACGAHPGCTAFSTCLGDCADEVCSSLCYAQHSSDLGALSVYNSIDTCALERCDGVCPP